MGPKALALAAPRFRMNTLYSRLRQVVITSTSNGSSARVIHALHAPGSSPRSFALARKLHPSLVTVRALSTNTKTIGSVDPHDNDNGNEKGNSKKTSKHVPVYVRNPKENRIPRGNIAFCALHTSYWGWYASLLLGNADGFFVMPSAGVYGLTFAMILNYACYTYSTIIVSKITFQRQSGKVRVWFHTLPFLTQSEKPVEFSLGEIFLDRKKAEVIYLLEKLGGNVTEFRGHLPLQVRADHHSSRWPLFVYCNDGFVVKDNDMFLEALLFDIESSEEDEDEEYKEDEYPSKNQQSGDRDILRGAGRNLRKRKGPSRRPARRSIR